MKAKQKGKRKPVAVQAPTPDIGAPETTTPTVAQLEALYGPDMPSTPPVDYAQIDKDCQTITESFNVLAEAAENGDEEAMETLREGVRELENAVRQCESAAPRKMPEPPKLEDAPVSINDTPNPNPAITQAEVVALYNAHLAYTLAAADLERRRGEMRLRLLQLVHVESGDFEISLTEDGKLLCVSHESVEEERIIIS